MSIKEEYIETAFCDEYTHMKRNGMDALLAQRLDTLLYALYRSGYVRGHSERSREVHQEEEQARREGKYPSQIDIKYEGTTLILDGREVHP